MSWGIDFGSFMANAKAQTDASDKAAQAKSVLDAQQKQTDALNAASAAWKTAQANAGGGTPASPGAPTTPPSNAVTTTPLAPAQGVSPVATASATPYSGPARPFDPSNIDGYLNTTKSIENPGSDPAARSSTGAQGDFQFTGGTAKAMAAKYGAFDPNDPAQARAMAGKLAIDNANQLASSLGRTPTEGEVYLAHQQGAGGAAALLANPGMNAVMALAQAGVDPARARQAILVNGGNPNMTAGQFAQKWTSRFGASPAASTPAQAPASATAPQPPAFGSVLPAQSILLQPPADAGAA